MGLTVVTYGGGEILVNIFNAIAMLMNSRQSGLIQPLMIIAISVGTLWAVAKAFFTSSANSFISHFMLPLIAIVGIGMVPNSSASIEDLLKHYSYKVDHVPFLVAKIAELSSSIGYQITKAIEKTMHVPKDTSYNTTGMIFGADTAMDISRYKICNADLEKNLRSFCRQCVLYDLHLGRYTIDELKKTTDLWKFLEERTSKVRMIKFTPIGEEATDKKTKSEYLSCKDALNKMSPIFEQEKGYYAQLDICKNLGLSFQALTGIQKNAEELISQQLMMNVLSDEYSGNNFAKSRAYLQQRNTYQILGSLASSSLVTLRAVIEALVYASFIFILPLSVLPGGFKFITTWLGLVFWIQLWPPFYAILNYIMQSVAHGYAETIFSGLTEAQYGLGFFTSFGLQNLQQDIYALSGYLAASIPFITYAILKGGVSSFVHLAGSMMSPAHSASTTAAAEQTSGNYSLANTSFGQTSYKNTSGLQSNLAPSMSGGFFHENSGTTSATYGQDEQIFKQSNSDLRKSLFSDDSISQSFQSSKMHAQSTAESAQKSYSESVASATRNLADFSSHLANSENFSNGVSTKEAFDSQESGRYFTNLGETFGKQFGISSRAGLELSLGAGWDLGVIAKASNNLGGNKEEAISTASNIVQSEEYQKNFQKLHDISNSASYGTSDEKGMRLAESFSQSFENMQNAQHSFQIAQTELNQVSENATWAEQNSNLIRHSRNQDFINWASDQYANEGGFSKVQDILNKGDPGTQGELLNRFISSMRESSPHFEAPKSYLDPQIAATHELPKDLNSQSVQGSVQRHLDVHNTRFNSQIGREGESLRNQFSQTNENYEQNFEKLSSKINSERAQASENFKSESERSLYSKSFDLASTEVMTHVNKLSPLLAKVGISIPTSEKTLGSSFQIKEEPFWMSEEASH